MKWFRLYSEILDDPKIQKLNDLQFRQFIYLLCYASELDKNGLIPMSDIDIAWRLRCDDVTLCDTLVTLVKLHIASHTTDGVLIKQWKKRQFKSDTSAIRTRRYRDKIKKSDVTETSQKRHSDGTDTDTDTDTDTEADKKKTITGRDSRVRVFIDWWFKRYEQRFKRKYVITNGKKTGEQVKNLLKSGLTFKDLQIAAMLFMLDEDPFLTGSDNHNGAGHEIGIFLSRLNKYDYTDKEVIEMYEKFTIDEKGEKIKEKEITNGNMFFHTRRVRLRT